MPTTAPALARLACTLLALGLLSACASKPQMSAQSESYQYRSRAGRNYTPPGPPSDPWGPYISEAAAKFDVPDRWIREVMRQESGGKLFGRNGDLVTSGAGAMGLMQVMPATYDELRARYRELGDDPYDPHNNIMAGTAYIREMYDIYGSPGFLAAYNAGPGRLDDYLTRNRTLPEETRRYVASIGPKISGSEPRTPSPGAQYAMNALPYSIPSGPRYAPASRYSAPEQAPIALAMAPAPIAPRAPIQLAQVTPANAFPAPARSGAPFSGAPFIVLRPQTEVAQLPEPPALAPAPVAVAAFRPAPVPSAPPPPVQFAQMPEPPRPPPLPVFAAAPRSQQQLASAALVPSRPSTFAFVSQANAEPIGLRRSAFGPASSGNWGIQVGAFANEGLAASATASARDHARAELAHARPAVVAVRQPRGTMFRARLNGLSRDSAAQACERLVRARTSCMVVSPDAQS